MTVREVLGSGSTAEILEAVAACGIEEFPLLAIDVAGEMAEEGLWPWQLWPWQHREVRAGLVSAGLIEHVRVVDCSWGLIDDDFQGRPEAQRAAWELSTAVFATAKQFAPPPPREGLVVALEVLEGAGWYQDFGLPEFWDSRRSLVLVEFIGPMAAVLLLDGRWFRHPTTTPLDEVLVALGCVALQFGETRVVGSILSELDEGNSE